MPVASKVMIAFGGVVFLCALIGWTVAGGVLRWGLVLGLAAVAAGAAAAQGRTSLRKTGNFLGIFLPVLAAGFYGWRAIQFWKTGPTSAAVLLTLVSLAGLLTVSVLMKLRSGDNIAERGYSILPLQSNSTPAPEPQENHPVDRT